MATTKGPTRTLLALLLLTASHHAAANDSDDPPPDPEGVWIALCTEAEALDPDERSGAGQDLLTAISEGCGPFLRAVCALLTDTSERTPAD